MQQAHGTYVVSQDTGLTPRQQAEREALAHFWALRIRCLMDISGCTAQQAAQAVQDAMKEQR